MAGIALLYALGAGTPVFRLLYSVVPGLKNFRAPSLAAYLAIVALTLLAALLIERALGAATLARAGPCRWARSRGGRGAAGRGHDAGCRHRASMPAGLRSSAEPRGSTGRAPSPPTLRRLAAGALIVALICGAAWGAVFLWSRGTLRASHVVIILTLLTAIDLMRVDDRYIQVVRYDDFFPPDPGIEALRARLVPGERVLTVGGVYPEGFLASYGVPEVFGYHGNQLRWYNDLTRYDVRQSARTTTELRAVLAQLPDQRRTPRAGRPVRASAGAGGAARAIDCSAPTSALRCTSMSRDAGRCGGARSAGRARFRPADRHPLVADVRSGQDHHRGGAGSGGGTGGGTGTAVIEGNGDDTLAVRVRSTGPALLHVSRTYHQSWQAEIDGVPVPVIRANHALMAVPLTGSGEHRVVMRYRPSHRPAGRHDQRWSPGRQSCSLTLLGAVLHLRRARG